MTPRPADDTLGRYTEMKDEIGALRSTVVSQDKSVTVVAGPGGSVVDIQLNEQAMRAGSAKALAGTIMSTLRLAVADAARQQADVVQRYVGDRLNVRDRVLATQEEFLGDRIEAGQAEEAKLTAAKGPAGPSDSIMVTQSGPARPEIRRARPRSADHEEEPEGFAGLDNERAW